jgi:hypothetical protein
LSCAERLGAQDGAQNPGERTRASAAIAVRRVRFGNYLFSRIVNGVDSSRSKRWIEFVRSPRFGFEVSDIADTQERIDSHSHWNKQWIHSVGIR